MALILRGGEAMRSWFAALLLLPLLSSSAVAQATGNDLLSDCKQLLKDIVEVRDQVNLGTKYESRLCWGFMSATQQFMFFGEREGKIRALGACVPDEATTPQLIRIVVSYGEKHPEELQYSAAYLASHAIQEAFPCPKQ